MNRMDIEDIDMCLTFIKATGATSITFEDFTVAKLDNYFCYLEDSVLKFRALSETALLAKVKKLHR